ncbi:unnamed protein product [Enterobius vermicularis]|uniref:Uncharacterized protein n=1 Tax=Enterobius vermicularis TaxID=51028 RepID=A0A0N4V679_ENTVE|nr:unnamed protein product [Enterobius vermicularis]
MNFNRAETEPHQPHYIKLWDVRGMSRGNSFFEICNSPSGELELVDKLEQVGERLALSEEDVEAAGLLKDSRSLKEYIILRDKLRSEVPDPLQFDSKTDLHLGSAAIAGAKVLVDEQRTTRSMSKKLVEQCGSNEENFLYNGIKNRDRDLKCAEQIAKLRKSAVLESLVDFQKQIDFKGKVLKHVANRAYEKVLGRSKSDSRANRLGRPKPLRVFHRFVMKTPRFIRSTKEINPLDDEQILDSYAIQVASEATRYSRRKSFGTVPFNRALLDEED